MPSQTLIDNWLAAGFMVLCVFGVFVIMYVCFFVAWKMGIFMYGTIKSDLRQLV